jgi:hypothetical protein
MKAQKFLTSAKEEFKKYIPRDAIDDIGVTQCAEKDGAFEITGSVGATSPTGKEKTYGYCAVVAVDEGGNASLLKLQVSER